MKAALSSTATRVGAAATISGSVSPFRGVTVALQRRTGSGWVPVTAKAIAVTAASGAFRFSVPTGVSGTRTYRVVASGASIVSSTSAQLTMRVYRVGVKTAHATTPEYVTLANTGAVTVHLRGWTLKDSSGKALTLPKRDVKPGKTLRVYTGKGKSTSTRLYLGKTKDVWSRHDVATLRNASGLKLGKLTY